MTPQQRRRAGVLTGLALSVAASLPVSGFAKGDLDRLELSGDVRTVVTRHAQLTTTHQFDRNGRLSSLELASADKASSARYVYLRDESGRLIEQQTFESDGKMVSRKLFRYGVDGQGRQTAEVAVTENGALVHVVFSQYDSRGFLSEEIMVTGQGIAEKSLYAVGGDLVYHARYFQGRLMLEATHSYAPIGRLKESRFYGADGELTRKDVYRYDRAGNRVEQLSEFHRHSHLRKSVTAFEVDHAGNWTKETIQRWSGKNGSVASTETVVSREREISYY